MLLNFTPPSYESGTLCTPHRMSNDYTNFLPVVPKMQMGKKKKSELDDGTPSWI